MEKQIGRLQIEPEDNKMDETPPAKRSRLELVKEMLSNAPKVPGRIHCSITGALMSFHNQKTTSGFVKLAIIYDGTHFIQVSCFGVEIAELEHVRPCTTVHITELIVTGIKEAKYNNGTAEYAYKTSSGTKISQVAADVVFTDREEILFDKYFEEKFCLEEDQEDAAGVHSFNINTVTFDRHVGSGKHSILKFKADGTQINFWGITAHMLAPLFADSAGRLKIKNIDKKEDNVWSKTNKIVEYTASCLTRLTWIKEQTKIDCFAIAANFTGKRVDCSIRVFLLSSALVFDGTHVCDLKSAMNDVGEEYLIESAVFGWNEEAFVVDVKKATKQTDEQIALTSQMPSYPKK